MACRITLRCFYFDNISSKVAQPLACKWAHRHRCEVQNFDPCKWQHVFLHYDFASSAFLASMTGITWRIARMPTNDPAIITGSEIAMVRVIAEPNAFSDLNSLLANNAMSDGPIMNAGNVIITM